MKVTLLESMANHRGLYCHTVGIPLRASYLSEVQIIVNSPHHNKLRWTPEDFCIALRLPNSQTVPVGVLMGMFPTLFKIVQPYELYELLPIEEQQRIETVHALKIDPAYVSPLLE